MGSILKSFTPRPVLSIPNHLQKAGIQHYRFHDLRHINASVMLALGIPNKYAEERMGHATDNMLKPSTSIQSVPNKGQRRAK